VFEYKVIAGIYSVEGADVVVENPSGKGTLQRILDHYGREGFDLVSTHYDNLNREIVLLLKKGGSVAAAGMPLAAAPAPEAEAEAEAAEPDDEVPVPRRGKTMTKSDRSRRSKADLDRLYRDS
jgi:division protein CdvB (Snf7/Vps24/ESCRT-III family)